MYTIALCGGKVLQILRSEDDAIIKFSRIVFTAHAHCTKAPEQEVFVAFIQFVNMNFVMK